MFTGRMGRIAVFCSYAREDTPVREALERRLAPLRETRVIDDWYDSHIRPGAHWDDEIQQALERSRLVLFIVSPDLLASRYVAEVELPRGLERERAGECRLVPILARRAEWKSSPLSGFQALPGGGRWLDDAADAERGLDEVVAGIREVCRQIVDWENPYKRAQVGDWTFQEQTITLGDGRSVTAQGSEELIAKTDTEATLRLEMLNGPEWVERVVTIDLTRPLEDRLADVARQNGTQIPANLEMSTGPATYGEEHVSIGGRRYETVRARRELTLAMRGLREQGHVTQWRSIDVPLYGLVKGEGELPGWRQYQVLLDYGHGDAHTRKPRLGDPGRTRTNPGTGPVDWLQTPTPPLASGGGAPWSPRSAPTDPWRVAEPPTPGPTAAPAIGPGHWIGQMHGWGTRTDFELLLHPSGSLQGRQVTMGMQSDLSGSWMYHPANGMLSLQVIASVMGAPAGQELIQITLTGQNGAMVSGQDATGRIFQLQRAG